MFAKTLPYTPTFSLQIDNLKNYTIKKKKKKVTQFKKKSLIGILFF